MTYLEKKIKELWREFIDQEYQNMPVKSFCDKYQICYLTCIAFMGRKERSGHYQKRWQASYKKVENERGLNTEKWEYKEHNYKIVGELVEKSYLKWLCLSKNSGYTVQH
jgi:hypothetical protein